MDGLKELREKRSKFVDEIKELMKAPEGETRDLSDDEQTQFDEKRVAVEKLDGEITTLEKRQVDRAWLVETEERLAKPVHDVHPILDRGMGDGADDGVPAEFKVAAAPVAAQSRFFKDPRTAYRALQWMRGGMLGIPDAKRFCRSYGIPIEIEREKRAMGGGSNFTAAYLIPDEFINDFIINVESFGDARQTCDLWNVNSDQTSVPKYNDGPTVAAVGDGQTISDSDVSVTQVMVTPKKIAALTKLSSELMEDVSMNVVDMVFGRAAAKMAAFEDDSWINGDGTSTYNRIVGLRTKSLLSAHSASLYTGSVKQYSTVVLADLEGVMAILPSYADANAKWLVSKKFFILVMERLANKQGGSTKDDLLGPTARQYGGYPVIINQKCHSLATTDASVAYAHLGDFRAGSIFADRRSISMAISEHAYFASDQIGLRVTERYDIQNHDLGDTSNAGPICVLKSSS